MPLQLERKTLVLIMIGGEAVWEADLVIKKNNVTGSGTHALVFYTSLTPNLRIAYREKASWFVIL